MDDTIVYISGGALGDFIHQLSIINEMYLTTGKKGILYLNPVHFNLHYEKTYNDTYSFVIKQPYIQIYSIWKGEPYDFDLSSWRNSDLLYKSNFQMIFNSIYDINWGRHPWLICDKNPLLEKKILFSCSNSCYNRFPDKIDFRKFFDNFGIDNILFITQTVIEHTQFRERTGIDLELYIPTSIEDFVISINSCALFIGNLSSPLTYAYALHKKNITLLNSNNICNPHHIGYIGMDHVEICINYD
jgi:hypothetical protein